MEIEVAAVVIMVLRHLVMVVEIVEEVMVVMAAIQEVDIVITIEALLQDHMAAAIVIEGIADQEDLLGNEVAHHMVEVIGIEIEREEDHEVVVLIIEGEVDINLVYRNI